MQNLSIAKIFLYSESVAEGRGVSPLASCLPQ